MTLCPIYSSTRNDILQCFVCSPIPKVSEKKGATTQSFIRKEITSCKLHTLVLLLSTLVYSKVALECLRSGKSRNFVAYMLNLTKEFLSVCEYPGVASPKVAPQGRPPPQVASQWVPPILPLRLPPRLPTRLPPRFPPGTDTYLVLRSLL